MSAKEALARVRAPDEHGAEERAWTLVRSAYLDHPATVARRSRWRVALVPALFALLAGVALSPAGAAVSRVIRQALGVQHASPGLFSLPAPGGLLISGPAGTWTVAADGASRRLGDWPQASFSPHGLYIAAAQGDELAVLDPHGVVRWTLARPAVSDPRWYSPTGYRIAYLSGHDLRVVAGDGTADHLLAAGVAKIAPAWRPGHPYQLGYLTEQGRIVVRDADTGQALWSASPSVAVDRLAWSADGQRLLALSSGGVRVYSAGGVLRSRLALPHGAPAVDGALSPDGHTLALVLGGGASDVVIEDLNSAHWAPHRVLAGAGLAQVAWSPDAKWLLVSWPAADQWVFVRVAGGPRIEAVSRIAQQFAATAHRGFPQLDGWCCIAEKPAG